MGFHTLSNVLRSGSAQAVLLAALCSPLHAAPMAELYRQALAIDPAVAAAQAQWRAAEQRVVQAQAAFGPTAAVTIGETDTRYREAPSFEMRPFRNRQRSLQVTQPLLRNALVPALDSALAQLDQAAALLAQAQADSGVRLVEAAFDLMKARDAVALARAQRLAVDEQLRAAQRGFRVGTAPATDVREAEARADAVTAQGVAAQVDLDLREQVLAELVGTPAPGLLELALDGDRLPNLSLPSIAIWLADAQAGSPQVQQAQQALQVAQAELAKAWQGHAPTADLTFTHTESSESGSLTSIFARRGDSTAVGINVNIPLFASGATQARVKEAMALGDKARAELDSARRNLSLNMRQAFAAALSAIAQAHSLQTALRSQEAALHANRRAYEVGMKVNAEVLDAQSRLFEIRRDLARARYDAWLGLTKLKALSGRLGEADVAVLDSLLLPTATALREGRAP